VNEDQIGLDPRDFCQCEDPGKCPQTGCGLPIGPLGLRDPSGKLADRWMGCTLCDQQGRLQLGRFFRWFMHLVLSLVIAFFLGYLAAKHWS